MACAWVQECSLADRWFCALVQLVRARESVATAVSALLTPSTFPGSLLSWGTESTWQDCGSLHLAHYCAGWYILHALQAEPLAAVSERLSVLDWVGPPTHGQTETGIPMQPTKIFKSETSSAVSTLLSSVQK